MRKTLLIITAVMLVIGCSKPINDETLIDVDGLKYHPETKELYSGDVFKNYLGGKTEFEGSYKAGKADGKWTYWDKEGRKVSEGIYRDGLWTESFSLTQFLLEVDIPTLVENLAVPVKPQADSLLAAIISDEKKAVAKKPLSAVLFSLLHLTDLNCGATLRGLAPLTQT